MGATLHDPNQRLPQLLRAGAVFLSRHWRFLVLLVTVVSAISWALDESDRQGRSDGQLAYSVGMMCEADPEAPLWNGGCERIAADIARKDKPSFAELYRAFTAVHHGASPGESGARRTASLAADPAFDLPAALKGTRYVISREEFAGARSLAEAEAIMDEIDARDRARLTIRRAGLSFEALLAGALANLTTTPALVAAACLLAFFWLTRPRS